jgi:hypothetical protein
MTLDDLKKYMDPPQHARVRGVDTPPYRRQRRPGPAAVDEPMTLSEALRDPGIGQSLDQRHSIRMRADPGHDLTREESFYGDDSGFGHEDAEPHCDVPSAEAEDILVSADDGSLPVTVLSDEEPDPEENSTQEVLDFRSQRRHAMRRRFDVDNWDTDERWNGPNTVHIGVDGNERESSWNLRRLDSMMARSRMDDSPQRTDPSDDHTYIYDRREPGRESRIRLRDEGRLRDDNADADSSYRDEPPADGSERYDDGLNDPNVTRARFHIRDGKYKVAIRFDPPVSGRFILLKLWANRSNVDLQSVIAKGYGGLRFFSAVDMR